MKRRKLGIYLIVALFMASFVFTSTGFEVYAATVGELLTQPEIGFQRIEENNAYTSYPVGTWVTQDQTTASGGWRIYNQSANSGDKITFKFKGTKFYILGHYHTTNYTRNTIVKVDGEQVATIDQYSSTPSYAPHIQAMVTGLEDVTHEVEIIVQDSKFFVFDAIDIDEDGELLDPDVTIDVTTLDIEAPSYEIPGGTEFETYAVIKEASSIYAEDINIEYDDSLFELISAETVDSIDLKIYHEEPPTEGEARYVVASKGSENALDGDEQILKLTFKAKNVDGSGDIEVSSGLVADGEGNEIVPSFGGKTFTVTMQNLGDVNNDGKFSLGDLAIAGRLFASTSDTWEAYEPDVDANGDVEDIDLTSIVQSILDNE